MTFNTLGLQETLLRAIKESGYTTPTPIQQQAIPAVLSGRNVMAAAQTGTGKTDGFTLPVLQQLSSGNRAKPNHVRALILTPTRELAAQVRKSIQTYGRYENLRSVEVFGGVKINPQMMNLRKGADILVATPGRLLDLYQQNAVKFSTVEMLVLDEADRMLDMGFSKDINRILKLLPKERQNLMFSATFSNEIRTLAKGICPDPVEIDVAPRNSTVETITQRIYMVKKDHKMSLLTKLLQDNPEQTLVFSRTKHGANKLAQRLNKEGINSAAIHGNKSQNQRMQALNNFKQNKVQVLVATDIAARGIDIDQLSQVINFDLPNVAEDYVHRIGRTGRAGTSGVAISLVSSDEKKLLKGIERLIKRTIDREELPAYTVPDKSAVQESQDERERQAPRHGRSNAQNNRSAKPRRRTRKPASGNTGANGANKGQQPQSRDGSQAQSRDASQINAQGSERSNSQAQAGSKSRSQNRSRSQAKNRSASRTQNNREEVNGNISSNINGGNISGNATGSGNKPNPKRRSRNHAAKKVAKNPQHENQANSSRTNSPKGKTAISRIKGFFSEKSQVA